MSAEHEPAYPSPIAAGPSGDVYTAFGGYAAPGMTKLEHYAGLAMQGLCANSELASLDSEKVAKWSVDQAKALIAEIEKEARP